jgi:hypothetical protein
MNSEKSENGPNDRSGHAPTNDLVVEHTPDDLARLLIKIRRGEAGYDLVIKFLHESRGPSRRRGV